MDKESISAVLTNVLVATKVACCIAVTAVVSLLLLDVIKTVKQVNDGTHPIIHRYDALYSDLHAVARELANLEATIDSDPNSNSNESLLNQLNAAIKDFRALAAQANGTADSNVNGTITRLNSILDSLKDGTLLQNQTNVAEIRTALNELTRMMRGLGDTVNTIAHPLQRLMGTGVFSPKYPPISATPNGHDLRNNPNTFSPVSQDYSEIEFEFKLFGN